MTQVAAEAASCSVDVPTLTVDREACQYECCKESSKNLRCVSVLLNASWILVSATISPETAASMTNG